MTDHLFRYSEKELIIRALRNARPRGPTSAPRWSAVEEAFGMGSTLSAELCRIHSLDPDEILPGNACERCAEDAADDARVVAPPISQLDAYRNLLLDMLADLEEGSTDPTWPAKIRALVYPAPEPQPSTDNDGTGLLIAANHALRSYQYGNAATELAESVADKIDAYLKATNGRSIHAQSAASGTARVEPKP